MSLKNRINEDLKTAMKAKDKEKVSVLRMIVSEMKYAAAQVNVHQELSDEEVAKVVGSYHKKLTKSLDDYPEGEQRSQIKHEIEIVEGYLPKKASEAEVLEVIEKVLSQDQANKDKNFGILMKSVMEILGASADGRMVSKLLKEKVGG
jgi:uncharacterized protein YqeY